MAPHPDAHAPLVRSRPASGGADDPAVSGTLRRRLFRSIKAARMMKSLASVARPSAAHAAVAATRPFAPWGDDIKRILCVRTDNLGAVLMTTPAFHALRAACPDRRLTLLTSAA